MSNEIKAAEAASQVKRGRGRPRKVAPATPSPTPEKTEKWPYYCGSVKVSGKCQKIKIIANGDQLDFPRRLSLKLGDLPRIKVLANREIILPVEYISILKDTQTEILVSRVYSEGDVERFETKVRIPYQFIGEVTWEEYQAFRAEENKKPVAPPKADPYA